MSKTGETRRCQASTVAELAIHQSDAETILKRIGDLERLARRE
jgi:hypothetical protein